MAVNTEQLNDGKFVTTSSISIVGGPSRTTLKAEDVVATSVLSTAALTVQGALTANGAVTAASTISAVGQLSAGLAQFNSKVTLGAQIISSATTAQSAATSKVLDGQLIFSVLSLTTNGAALYYRSGNTVYTWASGVVSA